MVAVCEEGLEADYGDYAATTLSISPGGKEVKENGRIHRKLLQSRRKKGRKWEGANVQPTQRKHKRHTPLLLPIQIHHPHNSYRQHNNQQILHNTQPTIRIRQRINIDARPPSDIFIPEVRHGMALEDCEDGDGGRAEGDEEDGEVDREAETVLVLEDSQVEEEDGDFDEA